jgi:hypothetical protein
VPATETTGGKVLQRRPETANPHKRKKAQLAHATNRGQDPADSQSRTGAKTRAGNWSRQAAGLRSRNRAAGTEQAEV